MCSVQVHCRHSHLLRSCIEFLNIYSDCLGSVSCLLSLSLSQHMFAHCLLSVFLFYLVQMRFPNVIFLTISTILETVFHQISRTGSLVSSVQVGCRQKQQLPAISLPIHRHKNKLNVKDTLVLLELMLIGPQELIIAAPVAWVTLIQKTLNSYRGLLLQTKEY